MDCVDGDNSHIVDPKSRHEHVCEFAHDRAGYLGARKACQMIQKCLRSEILVTMYINNVKSCEICRKSNRRGQSTVLMVERLVDS